MKFGATSNVLGVGSDRKDSLRIAREIGCEGVEAGLPVASIRTGDTTMNELMTEAEAIRTDYAEAGLDIVSLTPNVMPKHAQHPDVIDAVCRTAQAMGTRQVRMFSSPHVRWGGPGSTLDDWMADFDGTRSARHWLQSDADNIARILDLSAAYDVRYVFELHGGYVINSASGAMRLLDRHPADRVGIIMDPGNMVIEGNEGWRNCVEIMGEYLAYIHCKNTAFTQADGRWMNKRVAMADGIASFPQIVTALKDIGFDGYLCIEEMRKHGDLAEMVRDELTYLRDLVASTERTVPH